jgi:hypothetical protein
MSSADSIRRIANAPQLVRAMLFTLQRPLPATTSRRMKPVGQLPQTKEKSAGHAPFVVNAEGKATSSTDLSADRRDETRREFQEGFQKQLKRTAINKARDRKKITKGKEKKRLLGETSLLSKIPVLFLSPSL